MLKGILLVLGAPIWLPLLIIALTVYFVVWVVMWTVVVCLWSVFVSFAAAAVGCSLIGVWLFMGGHIATGTVGVAAVMVCTGLSIFTFVGCKAATIWCAELTKSMVGLLFRRGRA